ncbi:MAG TPA: hypothetical protein VLR54_03050, partial [Methanobacteriaceae archaeon]|nr:hypothetical protein [Methanobacteriaceae archaeon]
VIVMRNYQTFIKACREEYVYLDKKLRERRYKVEKYIITLDEKSPFKNGEDITIISSEDYQLLIEAVKKLKKDKISLQKQLEYLKENKNQEYTDINRIKR